MRARWLVACPEGSSVTAPEARALVRRAFPAKTSWLRPVGDVEILETPYLGETIHVIDRAELEKPIQGPPVFR